jgi:hypothetical protein
MKLYQYYAKYRALNSNVTFYHWLEGEVQSIAELARELNYPTIDDLKKACKEITKTR